MKRKRPGFNAVELLVILAVLFFLMALVGPLLQILRERERQAQTRNQLQQVGRAVYAFHDAMRFLPPAFAPWGNMKKPVSLSIHLLPYLEGFTPLYNRIESEGIENAGRPSIPPYCAIADPTLKDGALVQNFAGNIRVFTDNGFSHGVSAEVAPQSVPAKHLHGSGKASITQRFQDGTFNVIMLATKYAYNDPDRPNPDFSNLFASLTDAHGAFFGMNIAKLEAGHAGSPDITFQLKPPPGAVLC